MSSPSSPHPRRSTLRVGLAAGVGTSLEFYDFAIYGTASALVFGDLYFHAEDPWFGAFMALATFAIGFVMAPLGAAIFGWIGDRYGRRPSLLFAFISMGAATLVMGMLPTYAAIGFAAPVLLVLLRMVHGLARGGENAGAAVFAIEHAPERLRGVFGAFVAIGSPIGMILANIAFALVLFLPSEAVLSWGWRIPFLLGGVVLVFGIWIRRNVDETPEFEAARREQGEQKQALPLWAVLRTNWRRVLLTAGVNVGLNASTFALVTFMLSYATAAAPQGLGLDRQPIVLGSLAGLVVHAVVNMAAAWLSDRWGRRPVMLTGVVLSFGSALLMFVITGVGTIAAVNTAIILGLAATGVLFGPMYTFFAELFPREQRQSGSGFGFHVGAVLGGGISPLVANRIIAGTGEPLYVGYYLAGLLVVSAICLILLPETAPARGRAREHARSGVTEAV